MVPYLVLKYHKILNLSILLYPIPVWQIQRVISLDCNCSHVNLLPETFPQLRIALKWNSDLFNMAFMGDQGCHCSGLMILPQILTTTLPPTCSLASMTLKLLTSSKVP